ncbi:MAG: diguanylate cyclase [Colwellia sp.]|nr:diguanylate cyclase [Colwellia sp.]
MAFQTLPIPFEQIIMSVETAKNKNPSAALNLLNSYQLNLNHLKVVQRIQYYKILAEIYSEQDLFYKSKIISDKGLALAKELTSPSIVIAELLYLKGFSLESLGDIEAAELNYENGLELAKSLDKPIHITEGLINLGAIYYQSERWENSIRVLNQAYNLASQTDDENLKGMINSELGILYTYLGQGKKSRVYYRQGYQHYLNAGKIFYAYYTLNNLALSLSRKEQYEDAISLFKEVIDGASEINSQSLMYSVYSGLSWALLKQNESDPEGAYQYILLAGQYVEGTEHHNAMLYFLFEKTEVLKELKRYEESLDVFYLADLLFVRPIQPQDRWFYINTLYLKAEIFNFLGRYQEAYQLMSEVIEQVKAVRQKENLLAVDDLRLQYESKQADLQKELLVKNKALQNLELAEVDRASVKQRQYLIISALFALIFAWLVLKLIYGQKSLLKASRTDSLTGMLNRRHILQLAQELFKGAQLNKTPLCVLMIDVDHFKTINDSFGHSLGDKVLKEISEVSNKTMRKADVFGRFGGEEFVAILPFTPLKQGREVAERLRLAIYHHKWPFEVIDTVSVSIGVSIFDESSGLSLITSIEVLLKEADIMLYQAKNLGRNKVCS